MEGETAPNVQSLGRYPPKRRSKIQIGESVCYEDEVSDAEPSLGQHDHDIHNRLPNRPADGKAKVPKRGDLREIGQRLELAAGVDQKHHTVVGEEGHKGDHDEAHDPTGTLEAVGQAQDTRPDYGDEDIGKGLGLR